MKPRQVVAIAAGKGGVGKSTLTVCMAQGLSKQGFKVGVLDADVYGPSLPIMMPIVSYPEVNSEGKIEPARTHDGIYCMSMGYLLSPTQAAAIRAPKANALVEDCLTRTDWKGVDYLLIDFPPGTGDIPLTVMQKMPLDAAILVTTPQRVALSDVQRAASLLHSMQVPILGIVENMSYAREEKTDAKWYPFGQGGGEKLAKKLGVPLLAEIPLDSKLSQALDRGKSIYEEKGFASLILEEMIRALPGQLAHMLEKIQKTLKQFDLTWKE